MTPRNIWYEDSYLCTIYCMVHPLSARDDGKYSALILLATPYLHSNYTESHWLSAFNTTYAEDKLSVVNNIGEFLLPSVVYYGEFCFPRKLTEQNSAKICLFLFSFILRTFYEFLYLCHSRLILFSQEAVQRLQFTVKTVLNWVNDFCYVYITVHIINRAHPTKN
jgi:hypothetical protein